MDAPIRNLYEADYQPRPFPTSEDLKETYDGVRIAMISKELGAKQLGYNVAILQPNMRAYPFHVHKVLEEMFLVLEGEGTLRYGENEYPLKKGDVIACLPGDERNAHQIINTSDAELRYLSVSDTAPAEVSEYPDSGKFGVLGKDIRFIGRKDESLDYWEGNR